MHIALYQQERTMQFIPAKLVTRKRVEAVLKDWTLDTLFQIDADETFGDVARRAASEAFEILCQKDHSRFSFPFEFEESDGYGSPPVMQPLAIYFVLEVQEDEGIAFAGNLGEMVEWMLGSYRRPDGILWDTPTRVREFCAAFVALAEKVKNDIAAAEYPTEAA